MTLVLLEELAIHGPKFHYFIVGARGETLNLRHLCECPDNVAMSFKLLLLLTREPQPNLFVLASSDDNPVRQ